MLDSRRYTAQAFAYLHHWYLHNKNFGWFWWIWWFQSTEIWKL